MQVVWPSYFLDRPAISATYFKDVKLSQKFEALEAQTLNVSSGLTMFLRIAVSAYRELQSFLMQPNYLFT
jgi:hypothetical protein